MKKFLLISLTCFITTTCISQSFNKARIDSLCDVLEKKDKFMGSIAVSKNGKLLYSKAIGYSDIENSIKANIQTKYRVGSVSKIFTATLILKAVEENKINLNQTLDNYFPEIEKSKKITIENLLNHRSGIHNFTNDSVFLSYYTTYKSQKDMIKIISNSKSDFEPNSKALYSNSNYVLLSYILEKIYKKKYSKIINEKIITPLGLKNTYFGGKTNIKINESFSYDYDEKWLKEPESSMSIPMGAGAIVSNPMELNVFIEQLFLGKIISEKSLTLMKTMNEKFGLGMFEFMYHDKKAYGHTGSIDGFQSVLNYFPEEKLSISIVTNGATYSNKNILECIESSYFNKPFEVPTFESIQIGSAILNSFVGVYASVQIPIKITITVNEEKLFAQATGQSAFPLEASSAKSFKYEQAGIVLEFNDLKKDMKLKQGGKEYLFTKE
jgi:D-alanyl-D-alanine carboxypeptidase